KNSKNSNSKNSNSKNSNSRNSSDRNGNVETVTILSNNNTIIIIQLNLSKL
ncbi:11283_t:CDS:1, partial [Gigaspora margarita]